MSEAETSEQMLGHHERLIGDFVDRWMELTSQPIQVIIKLTQTFNATYELDSKTSTLKNASARLIHASRRTEHVTPLLRDLHWLRYPERIDYKLAVLVYRCLHGLAPSYLADEFTSVSEIESRWNLRSASTASLVVPCFQRKTLGGRAFPVAAAHAWNSLPSHVTSSSSLASFKRNLKTELFMRSYV